MLMPDITSTSTRNCPLCGASAIEILELPYPLFRHLDFASFYPPPNRIGRCKACRLVFRIVTPDEMEAIDAIYRSEEYSRHEEPHTVMAPGYDGPVTLPFLQAELLRPYLDREGVRVLDIGCFDGQLLSEISNRCVAEDLCGFDVGERPCFPKNQSYRFVTGGLEKITGRFDLIIMSHSMQYIRDVKGLFGLIKDCLDEEGVLFVQVPDFSLKPCSLLLGDLYYQYTKPIINNIFRQMEFEPTPLINDYFPRDVLIVARKSRESANGVYEDDSRIHGSISHIRDMAERLAALPRHSRMGILGTTIEAAFAEYCLGDQVSFFIDENPNKVGTAFHGKDVRHPRAVSLNDVVIIPMGSAGESIRERFSKQYHGSYVCV
jgi:SAM-dependent methyltransferase